MPLPTPRATPEAAATARVPPVGLSFEDVTTLVAAICRAPIVAVRFVGQTLYDAAGVGYSWDDSICRHAAEGDGPTVIDDVAADPRFADKSFVAGSPHLRFYAAAPLLGPGDSRLGVLCVMDTSPRTLDAQQIDAVRVLAKHVTTQIEIERLRAEQAQTRHRLAVAVDAADLGTFHWTLPDRAITWDAKCKAHFWLPPDAEVDSATLAKILHPADRERVFSAVDAAIKDGTPYDAVYRAVAPDGHVRWVHATGRTYRDADGTPTHFDGVARDVTTQKITEAELRDANVRLQSTLSAGDVATWNWDVTHNRVSGDANLLAMYGTTQDAPVEQYLAPIHPDDLAHVGRDISGAIESADVFTSEYRIRRGDGQYRWVLARGRVERDADGRATRLPGVVMDVTDRVTADRALRQSEARFRFLSELAEATRDEINPDAVMGTVARLLGRQMGVSRCAYADVRPDESFTIVNDYVDGCPTSAGEYVLAAFGARAASDMRADRTLVLRDVDRELSGPDGADTFNAIRIKAIICCPLVRAGRLVAMMAVHQTMPRDWTDDDVRLVEAVVERTWATLERARAVREREEAFDRLRLAQQAGRVGTFDWLIPENRIVWSAELEELYGVPAGGFEGDLEGWRKRVVPDDAGRVLALLDQCMRDGDPDCAYDFRVVLPDGAIRWMRGKAHFSYDAACRPLRMIGVNFDSTEQHATAEARESLLDSERVARAEAERVSRMKDEFLATLSHELRTPLNAILGWSQILRGSPGQSDDVAEGLETIERNARAQAQIIEDLLDMSRIISGKIRLDVQRLNLAPVIEAGVATVRPAAQAKGVRLQMVLDPNAGPITGDPGRLQQVVWNLLSNAIKFTPKGGRVQVLLERVDSHVEVSVSDTGQGIAREFLPFVFDRFRQADASTTRQHGGLGIGLALVKQLAELHGGSVRAKSLGEGAGATFVLSLPLTILHPELDEAAPRRHPTVGQERLRADEDCHRIDGVRVLVIDDEPDARALVRRLLEDCHAAVTTAGSAAEAVERLDGGTFDVIVSDIGMPVEDGYALIRRIRRMKPEQGGRIPAIALTAYARSEDRMRSVVAGFQMHIPKPVEPAELITMVASLAGRTR